jgi:hypothetical protein
MPRNAQLVLPTVESCIWRRTSDELACCGLVERLLPIARVPVSLGACSACCESFPPTEKLLNPVVASLVRLAADGVIREGRATREQLAGLRAQSERALNAFTHAQAHRPDPAAATCESAIATAGPVYDPFRISRPLSLLELLPPPAATSGPAVNRWAVGVTTSPRRDDTLEQTLDSLSRAGFDSVRLFMDGTVRLPARYQTIPLTWREDTIGAWPTWYMSLAELVLHQPDADAFLLVQDDVLLADRGSLKAYLEQVLWPGNTLGIVSLFSAQYQMHPGWYSGPPSPWFSAQALLLPNSIARLLLCDADVSRRCLEAAGGHHIPIPTVLAEWAWRKSIPIYQPSPSLAQHIGSASTLWGPAMLSRPRRATWFAGAIDTPVATHQPPDVFPEDAFPCPAGLNQAYRSRVTAGLQTMSQTRAVICGLCRDVRVYLPRIAAKIGRLGAMFREHRVVLVENDSRDATTEFLQDWSKLDGRVDVISEQCGVKKFAQNRDRERTKWLAQCRNRYLDHVAAKYPEFEYLIVVDTDLAGGWSYDGIANTFGHQGWDAVASYGLVEASSGALGTWLQYDSWAFRSFGHPQLHRGHQVSSMLLDRGAPMMRVHSCFGGLAAYRTPAILGARYGGQDCEHVVLHQRMSDRGDGRIYLNPSQLTLYSPLEMEVASPARSDRNARSVGNGQSDRGDSSTAD